MSFIAAWVSFLVIVLTQSALAEVSDCERALSNKRNQLISELIQSHVQNLNKLFDIQANPGNASYKPLQMALHNLGSQFDSLAYDPRFIAHATEVKAILDTGFHPSTPKQLIDKMQIELATNIVYRGIYLTDEELAQTLRLGLNAHRSLATPEQIAQFRRAIPQMLDSSFTEHDENYSIQLFFHAALDASEVSNFISVSDYELLAESIATILKNVAEIPGKKWRILKIQAPRFDILNAFGSEGLLPPMPRRNIYGHDADWTLRTADGDQKLKSSDPGIERFIFMHINASEIMGVKTVEHPSVRLMTGP